MINILDEAQKELDAFFAGRPDEKKSVRIFLANGGCSGPMLSMALDDPNDGDVTEEVGGILYCMEKSLAERAKGVTVGVGYMGFMVTPENPVVDPSQFGCASCGCTGCGPGGCH